MKTVFRIFLVVSIFVMGGCGFLTPKTKDEKSSPILKVLPEIALSAENYSEVNTAMAVDAYQALKEKLSQSGQINKPLEYRLADLKGQSRDEHDAELTLDQEDLSNRSLISEYEALLSKFPDEKENDKVRYQLAKYYDMVGDIDRSFDYLNEIVRLYPDSELIAEVQFRRGEILFNLERFSDAHEAFSAVVTQGQSSPYLKTALYMDGWSLFKADRFSSAIDRFMASFDEQASGFREVDKAIRPQDDISLEFTSTEGSALLKDQLRVFTYAVNYLDGPATLKNVFERFGDKPYKSALYDYYARQLIENKRVQDAIDVYRQYVDSAKGNIETAVFQERLIQLYISLKQANDVIIEKAKFVQLLGPGTDYWRDFGTANPWYQEKLQAYTLLLANFHHVAGQDIDKGKNSYLESALNQAGVSKRYKQRYREIYKTRNAHYEAAIEYYDTYLSALFDDEQVGEIAFRKGEAQEALKHYRDAIETYEYAAYHLSPTQSTLFSKRADAAYAAISAYLNWQKGTQEKDIRPLEEARILSQIRFVTHFENDKRAIKVQQNTSTLLYQHQQYTRAIEQGRKILDWPNASLVSQDIQVEMSWMIAQSYFKLNDFRASANAARSLLDLLPNKQSLRQKAVELLASSLYRQAETLIAGGDVEKGIETLLTIGIEAPASPVRIHADYDAATHLIALKKWPAAAEVLESFRKRYPKHKLSEGIPEKLAYIYEQSEHWQLAANELLVIERLTPDKEKKRKALFQAATYFEKARLRDQSINAYRRYAHLYQKPLDLNVEAQHKLSEIYREMNAPLKRRFWLKRLMNTYSKYGKEGGDRLLYLAAQASSILADDKYAIFKKAKLTLPLAKSLRAKKKAFNEALTAYQKTADYQVAPFAGRATYRIGEIYGGLSKDIMLSQRPKGLDELELEQYEILLEEQAYPFEESAIEIHEINAQRAWQGEYDPWVKNSFQALEKLLPIRYQKRESIESFVDVM